MDKILFIPVSVVSGLLAGQIGKRLFALIWRSVDEQEPPKPEQRRVSYPKLVASLLIEGALFAVIRGVIDHFARQGYAQLTGVWPGQEEPNET
jgi:Protein of unknown function (DUF4235)